MILILGGTTEGRAAVRVAEEGNAPYYYSTKSEGQEIALTNGSRISGALDAEAMEAFCRQKNIRLLVDAAHPFAEELHRTVARVASRLAVPVVRYERKYLPRDPQITWCDTYEEAIERMETLGVDRLLALTGVQTIRRLAPFWQKHPCWFRILDREESVSLALGQGFPAENLITAPPSEAPDALIRLLRPDALLTKESGESGYFYEKIKAAGAAGIPVFAVKRPALPDSFLRVYGPDGLRKAIERLAPGFFRLRSGYTTGACATAAAKAALRALLTRREQRESALTLPGGEEITLPVVATVFGEAVAGTVPFAACTVIKDAGDDPDVTHGRAIVASVRLQERQKADEPFVIFKGGEGVGIVTLPGLGLEVGAPAINATPRRMIEVGLQEVLAAEKGGYSPDTCRVEVTVSVPGGREIALRTFNPKLGITGGISIIGTSGIVRPFSSEAFIASIRKEIEVAAANGAGHLVINSGAKSERFLKGLYPELPPQAFVHYGNFIGETLRIAASTAIRQVTMGIMIGKAVKLAEGFLDTHSKKVTVNREFLKDIARRAGYPPAITEAINEITLARELWNLFPFPEGNRFFSSLAERCLFHCTPLLPGKKFTLLLIDEEGNIRERQDSLPG
ncbi:MAG: cobalt-precorrin-5B (C(1))-methyltransferase CbiD [Parabacteroides sp.]|nr:cobalt-precorrin-5B (C(1))-methyltransferase CbiD [Parabacteroides sp.]